MEAIIYGGAFNPPTSAHLRILQETVDYARRVGAEVWVLPSGDRADKTIPTLRNVRLDYVNAMISDVDSSGVVVRVLENEIDREVAVETYDTIVELSDLFPEYDFTWVFGADSTATMSSWFNGDWMLENISILALSRPGAVINPAAKNLVLIDIPEMDVSSTEVRRRMVDGDDFEPLVPPSVFKLLTLVP
jgi:nicotinate-nucleotide adenylyltransferase